MSKCKKLDSEYRIIYRSTYIMTIKDLEKELIAKGGNLSGIYKITRKSDGKIYIVYRKEC